MLLSWLSALVVMCQLIAAIWMSYTDAQFERAWIAWVEAGLPTALEQLKPVPVPDEHNAALVYAEAYDLFSEIVDPDEFMWRIGEDDAYRASVVEQAVDVLQLIERAAAMEACVWPHNMYESGLFETTPHLTQCRHLARLVLAAALQRANANDYDTAANHLSLVLAMRRHVAIDEYMIAFMTALTFEAGVQQAISQYVDSAPVALLERLLQDMHETELRPSFQKALIGECLLALHTLDVGRREAWNGIEPWEEHFIRFLRHNDAALVDIYLQAIRQLDAPFDEQDLAFASDEAIDSMPMFAQIVVPALATTFRNTGFLESDRRLLAAAIELRRYRDAHGEYPETWPMPNDALTGKPMTYERTDDGSFILRTDATVGGRPREWPREW